MNGGKSTAESHSGDASPPTTGMDASTHNPEHELMHESAGDADKEVDEVTDMFADLAKKVHIPVQIIHWDDD